MRGPIDFIVVGFEGNNFNGSILKALDDAVSKEIINVIALAIVTKDKDGSVTKLGAADAGDDTVVEFAEQHDADDGLVSQEDIDEVADLLENNTSAGLLVIEHLWAKPLKKALIDANGVLVADGRIHPDAAFELNDKEDK